MNFVINCEKVWINRYKNTKFIVRLGKYNNIIWKKVISCKIL